MQTNVIIYSGMIFEWFGRKKFLVITYDFE